MAMRWPLEAGTSTLGSLSLACSAMCQSATKRSSRPMPTLSPLMPRTHLDSHCFSCGQTRPQTAGRELVEVTIW